LLVPLHTTSALRRIERLWRDVFRCVCYLYYYLFYGMESTGILNADNPIHVFTRHVIFIPKINKALDEFCEAFNHHKVRTEGNWSPYQMWANGMFHTDNPLAHGLLDEEPSDMEIYGYDPRDHLPLGEIIMLSMTLWILAMEIYGSHLFWNIWVR